jgi:hypothetical protein
MLIKAWYTLDRYRHVTISIDNETYFEALIWIVPKNNHSQSIPRHVITLQTEFFWFPRYSIIMAANLITGFYEQYFSL